MSLDKQHCVPCEGDVEPLGSGEIHTYNSLLKIPWEVVDDKTITHSYSFKDFKENMEFVNKIADIAESEGHHPDLRISYNKLKVALTTHAIKGLSPNDFILASKIEKLL